MRNSARMNGKKGPEKSKWHRQLVNITESFSRHCRAPRLCCRFKHSKLRFSVVFLRAAYTNPSAFISLSRSRSLLSLCLSRWLASAWVNDISIKKISFNSQRDKHNECFDIVLKWWCNTQARVHLVIALWVGVGGLLCSFVFFFFCFGFFSLQLCHAHFANCTAQTHTHASMPLFCVRVCVCVCELLFLVCFERAPRHSKMDVPAKNPFFCQWCAHAAMQQPQIPHPIDNDVSRQTFLVHIFRLGRWAGGRAGDVDSLSLWLLLFWCTFFKFHIWFEP